MSDSPSSPESPDSQELPDSLETSDSPDVRIAKYWQNLNTMSKFQNILDRYGLWYKFSLCLALWKLHWEGLKEDNDFNNATLAHEDGTQVRHTKWPLLHPVHNNTIFKQKSKSKLEKIYISNGENGVKTSKGTLVWTWPQKFLLGSFSLAKFGIVPGGEN